MAEDFVLRVMRERGSPSAQTSYLKEHKKWQMEKMRGKTINEKLFMTGRDVVKYVLEKNDTRERIRT